MKYRYLIFDADGTLLDFNQAYANAQQAVAEFLKVHFSLDFIRVDEKLSWELWSEFNLDKVEDPYVQRHYHSLYESYLREHFARLAEAFGVKANAAEVVDAYYAALSSSKHTMEKDTLNIYYALSQQYQMIIATNGMSRVQRSRLADFSPLTAKIYISEELGSIKPSRQFFDRIINDFGGTACEYLMIGDSISSDISGAKEVGMSACWYNAKQQINSSKKNIDFTISRLSELRLIV